MINHGAPALVLCLLLAGCGQAPAPESATTHEPALVSGIDRDGFDASVRPQDDFYAHVNGQWIADTEMPADRARWGAFFLLHEKSQRDVLNLIEEVSTQAEVEANSPTQKIRDYYNAYMDAATTNELGIEPLGAELDAIGAAGSHDDVMRLFSTLGMQGVNGPVGAFVFSDRTDPNTNVVYLSQAGLTLPDRDYYLMDDERFVQARALYLDFAARILERAGREEGADRAERLLALETRIAEAQWAREENRDPTRTHNPMTAAELAALAPRMNWALGFEAAEIPARDRYIVMQPSYFEAVDDIIADTDLDTWRDYLAFQTVAAFAPVLSDELFDLHFEFFQAGLQGVEAPQPRWKRAVDSINANMGELLGQLYVDRHFRPEAKARMDAMIRNLLQAYRESIRELDWMGMETRQAALAKLDKFTPKIAYPDQWRDYGPLEIVAGDLAGNVKRAALFEYRRNVSKLDRPVDRSEWFMTPQQVNAYYNPTWNEIVFPAAILQPPFFNVAADDAANYGGIGAVIGHEIGHGFDDQGRKADGDGNLRDWWTAEDNERFEQRKNRLVEQYNGYEVIDGLTINGQFTAGENIGDLGGLGIAYKAYRLSLGDSEAPVIDGWTGDQRFFLGWAQVWRAKARDEEARRLLTIDPHSPPRFRVNGTVVNVPAFYAAFDVQPGDGMYLPPEERIRIW
ncbi:MAG: peptidase M13 [Xanthomonadales bacterium]|nr:peptidase M13 [Xanthomonadales bacterium]NIN59020.1 peptidase M13 [Xanthomonadales bacterium]NIN74950.1 peptidase M13 [Xanthomonadales bacterium]NIO13367.1 peptidase M13 [Xanthomonadales bacterium]NIP11413.1 peptidase M13 [Xanthomonadales bacterium]